RQLCSGQRCTALVAFHGPDTSGESGPWLDAFRLPGGPFSPPMPAYPPCKSCPALTLRNTAARVGTSTGTISSLCRRGSQRWVWFPALWRQTNAQFYERWCSMRNRKSLLLLGSGMLLALLLVGCRAPAAGTTGSAPTTGSPPASGQPTPPSPSSSTPAGKP